MLARNPIGASSSARLRTPESNAPLLALYVVYPTEPRQAAIEPTNTTDAPRFNFLALSRALSASIGPCTFTRITCSQCTESVMLNGRTIATPAAKTAPSRAGRTEAHVSNPVGCSKSRTPTGSPSSVSVCSISGFRPHGSTLAPAHRHPSTQAVPMPPLAPITATVFPARLKTFRWTVMAWRPNRRCHGQSGSQQAADPRFAGRNRHQT